MIRNQQLPEIRFKNSWLLLGALDHWMRPEFEAEDALYRLDPEWVKAKSIAYQKAWKPYEEQMLQAMCETLKVGFYQNTIDIYVAPLGHSLSDPMIISTKYEPDRAIEVITHELLHRILTDNAGNRETQRKLRSVWSEMFGDDHSFITLVHIPVHAMLKHLFIDVLEEPGRYERDLEICQKWPHYKEAWDYVEAHDYRDIIQGVRRSYEV